MSTNYNILSTTKATKSNTNQEAIFYTIPIGRYVNRITNKKAPVAKGQLKIQVTKQRLIIRQSKAQNSEWFQIDTILIYNIDKIEDIQKLEDKYTLLKIQLNIVTEKEKGDKCITFRILNIVQGRESLSHIRKKMNQINNLPNYMSIQEKQATVMKSIILKQAEYYKVYKNAGQMKLFTLSDYISVLNFQRILLADHPQMIKFNLLKHSIKYQQEKNILIQKLKMDHLGVQNDNSSQAKNKFLQRRKNINLVQSTNIDKMVIEEDLQKIKKEGKQWLQGYSSKKQFQGYNFTGGGDEDLYVKDGLSGLAGDSNQIKKQNLILRNINFNLQHSGQVNFEESNYEPFGDNGLSGSKKNSPSQVQKMQIQQGEVPDKQENHSYRRICSKMKIPDSKDIKLEQKRQQTRNEKKSQIKFIDPSYSFEKQQILTKLTIIWCRLFYYYLKEGGIQKRQKQLSSIQSQLKKLKNSERQTQMNQLVAKMVEKVSHNYLRVKRGQDVY